ncbi:Josephin-domain-containing protein [Radiomyces spectabilis]|uniref:Josephin-domain-containing protein n=1 Tax=Radiomyces spectabilis TaxID=64574 RepID=UPI00221F3E86|nr:Josephin-domain-containing protein [Radiomyces spectabilis]KAI8384786.1 Josephin-domain-containing protein [Radiomyces spectabilis]
MNLDSHIVFEKQEGNLCAQHALNALLQGNYFTAVDLAEIGKELDDRERMMAGRQMSVDSHNYDDSGYFSIQVIQQALSVWNLELIPWRSEEAIEAREHPENEAAYICNLHQHWFTLRKFAVPWQWYNLNSTQSAPSHISETYLGLLVQQFEMEGYSVFVVRGTLPNCIADQIAPTLSKITADSTPSGFSGKGYSLTDSPNDDVEDEEIQLAKAIEASLQSNPSFDMDELRRKRLARFNG